MPIDYTVKAPGVYIEELTPAGPIAGVGTSTAAFIGPVVTAPPAASLGKAVIVTNWTQFTTAFGAFDAAKHLPYAVRGFFDNGGTAAYIVPTADTLAANVNAALADLTRRSDVSIVCAPGITDQVNLNNIISHCENMGDRFAILDGVQTDPNPALATGPLQAQKNGLTKSAYAGLYWPWIKIGDPLSTTPGATTTRPPSGHIAGIFARSDNQRGVHKAPANEAVRGAVDLGYILNNTEQGMLNAANINCLRSFAGQAPVLWGARTLSDNTAWRFVNVRRLFSYVEESLLEGVRWAVFEPNNTSLWKALERTITEFLTRVWQSGALFGRTAAQAFYVRIDDELNPPDVRALGQIFIEVGMAPVRPAEFVVVRIGMWDGGSKISEG